MGPPPGDEEIDAAQIGQVEGARLPAAGVILRGDVVAVANVVNRHLVAVDVGPGSLGVGGLPVEVLRGLDREPPAHNQDKPSEGDHHTQAATAQEQQRTKHHDEVGDGRRRP